MKKPLQSVFKPIFKAVLGVSKWWSWLHPLASFAYDLVNNRYMRSGGASTQALSLTEDRASSALVLQSNGTYVERYGPRTNAIPSDMAGSAVGVLGSGGSLPDGWSNTYEDTEVLAFDDSPGAFIDIRIQGTSPQYPALFLQPIDEASGLVTQVGDVAIVSAYVTRLPGPWTPIFNFNLNLQQRTLGNVFISQKASVTLSDLALGERRLVEVSFTITDPTAVRVFGFFTSSGNDSANRDLSIRIEKPQLELKSFRTPFIYGPAFTVSEPELAIGQGVGLQVSQAVENLFTNPEDLSHSDWQKGSNVTVTREVMSTPFGVRNVSKVSALGTTGFAYVRQGHTLLTDEHTGSFVIHQGLGRYMGLRVLSIGAGGFQAHASFDFDTGEFAASLSPEFDGVTVTPLSGGWYEVAATNVVSELVYRLAGVCISDIAGSENATLNGDEYFYVLWGDLTDEGFKAPHTVGTRAADNPVVVQGLGDELLADGDTPHNWGNNNAILTQNPDGSLVIASDGGFWQRAFANTIPLIAGVAYRGVAKYKVGTSGRVGIWMYSTTGPTQSYMSGTPGSLSQGTTTFGLFTDIVETLVGDVWEVSYTFTPSSTVPDAYPAISPQSDTAGENVTAISHTLKQILPYPNYNPDSQAYAETEIQQLPNPIHAGTVGNSSPSNYLIEGANALTILEAEVVDGITYNPVALRRANTTGYEGLRPRVDGVDTLLPVGTHLIIYYLRRVAGVSGSFFTLYCPLGSPQTTILKQAVDIDALPLGVMTRFTAVVTVTVEGTRVSLISNSGAVGSGYDIGPVNIILNTTQDVETQSEQGAFSRILASDGFASTVFPSAKDLVEGGGFDTQEDVDLFEGYSGAELSLVNGALRLDNVGPTWGGSRRTFTAKPGRVYRLSGDQVAFGGGAASVTDLHVGNEVSSSAYLANEAWADGPFYVLSLTDEFRVSPQVGSDTDGAWKEHDNISLQEVEPGVVLELIGKWGGTQYQRAFVLYGDADNYMLLRRSSDGHPHLRIVIGGVQTDYVSAHWWPDDEEGKFRLELTDTEGGCFASVFLDDVFIVGSDAFDYPHAINLLELYAGTGFKTITEIYGK